MSVNTVKLEVLWSPYHTNKFITWGSEIYLYEIAQINEKLKPFGKKLY